MKYYDEEFDGVVNYPLCSEIDGELVYVFAWRGDFDPDHFEIGDKPDRYELFESHDRIDFMTNGFIEMIVGSCGIPHYNMGTIKVASPAEYWRLLEQERAYDKPSVS